MQPDDRHDDPLEGYEVAAGLLEEINTSITANSRTKGFRSSHDRSGLGRHHCDDWLSLVHRIHCLERIGAGASALYDSLLLARSEAVKRNTAVSMNVTDLANGWTIVVTSDNTLLRTQEAFAGLQLSPANPSIAYNRLGRLSSGAGTE